MKNAAKQLHDYVVGKEHKHFSVGQAICIWVFGLGFGLMVGGLLFGGAQ